MLWVGNRLGFSLLLFDGGVISFVHVVFCWCYHTLYYVLLDYS